MQNADLDRCCRLTERGRNGAAAKRNGARRLQEMPAVHAHRSFLREMHVKDDASKKCDQEPCRARTPRNRERTARPQRISHRSYAHRAPAHCRCALKRYADSSDPYPTLRHEKRAMPRSEKRQELRQREGG